MLAHAPSVHVTSDDNSDNANNFSRRCREPVVARYQHWGRLSSDMWRCKAAINEENPSRWGYVLESLPADADERNPGSVGRASQGMRDRKFFLSMRGVGAKQTMFISQPARLIGISRACICFWPDYHCILVSAICGLPKVCSWQRRHGLILG